MMMMMMMMMMITIMMIKRRRRKLNGQFIVKLKELILELIRVSCLGIFKKCFIVAFVSCFLSAGGIRPLSRVRRVSHFLSFSFFFLSSLFCIQTRIGFVWELNLRFFFFFFSFFLFFFFDVIFLARGVRLISIAINFNGCSPVGFDGNSTGLTDVGAVVSDWSRRLWL